MSDSKESKIQSRNLIPAINIPDPVDGKEIELHFQWMRLHPCEILANDRNNTYDEIAIQASRAFLKYQSSTKCSAFLHANETRIEATELFDPELLSLLEEDESITVRQNEQGKTCSNSERK
mmetsp:Transcript_14235/g.21717  ORF Transcript_14235/g.21717 Transcript_14235/m.21717 type:complete len:121 (-) Transcript_14235:355-717(-)|eukprot:CAMPEP_0178901780 /NCGR_PEP_ID=MMETSP0786-20121207/4231_1 /TAXON_ID=186022 /ORGANISM="Thalassionema frauenfeldii, Strain CCMP 1798" /LENGTH=120 /DNA_ID=CAMNT_0020572957 /DNA_START=143 /DNA_END=505 /DNA_ORIENTATION=-